MNGELTDGVLRQTFYEFRAFFEREKLGGLFRFRERRRCRCCVVGVKFVLQPFRDLCDYHCFLSCCHSLTSLNFIVRAAVGNITLHLYRAFRADFYLRFSDFRMFA